MLTNICVSCGGELLVPKMNHDICMLQIKALQAEVEVLRKVAEAACKLLLIAKVADEQVYELGEYPSDSVQPSWQVIDILEPSLADWKASCPPVQQASAAGEK